MTSLSRRAATLATTAVVLAALAAPASAAPTILGAEARGPFAGHCGASAVVAYPPGTVDEFIIVGNDEVIEFQTFRVTAGRSPALHTTSLYEAFQLDRTKGRDKIDIEGATLLGGEAVWLGSHSRSGEGEARPARAQLFTTGIEVVDGVPRALPPQQHVPGGLLEALASIAALHDAVAPGQKEVSDLAPKKNGLNIEGLSVAADGTSLLVGLRGPLAGGSATLLTLPDAAALLHGGKAAPGTVRPANTVQLGKGMGIRSLEYSTARDAYFIVAGQAGSDDDPPDFELFLWDGKSDRPEPIAGLRAAVLAAGIKAFQPEALAVDATGTRLLILSDDETRCTGGAFNGVIVTLSP